jgi:hypothetical protein
MVLTPSIKLTKRYFFSLPAGKFLASNCFKPANKLLEITKVKPGTKPKGFDVLAGSYSVGFAPGVTTGDLAKAKKGAPIYVPLFAEPVAPLRERDAQWHRIKNSGDWGLFAIHYAKQTRYQRF